MIGSFKKKKKKNLTFTLVLTCDCPEDHTSSKNVIITFYSNDCEMYIALITQGEAAF